MRILAGQRHTHEVELIPEHPNDVKLLADIFALIEKRPLVEAALTRRLGDKFHSLLISEKSPVKANGCRRVLLDEPRHD